MDSTNLGAKSRRVFHGLDKILIEFSINPSWRNGITAYSLWTMVNGHGSGQRVQPRF
jgi:hypothetical protein